MYKEIFCTRIRNAREVAEYSQREVETHTEIPHSTVSKYENGIIEPDLEKLGTLADFYNVSIDWLLGLSATKDLRKN